MDKFDNCEECNNNECLECEEGYELESGECVETRRMLKSLVNDTAENRICQQMFPHCASCDVLNGVPTCLSCSSNL